MKSILTHVCLYVYYLTLNPLPFFDDFFRSGGFHCEKLPDVIRNSNLLENINLA